MLFTVERRKGFRLYPSPEFDVFNKSAVGWGFRPSNPLPTLFNYNDWQYVKPKGYADSLSPFSLWAFFVYGGYENGRN